LQKSSHQHIFTSAHPKHIFTSGMKICIASNSLHKIEEIKAALPGSVEILSLQDIGCHEELPETQDTIAGNSRQKAEYVWQRYQISCFADDSGLEVAALQNAPGVHSAYYAGLPRNDEKNIDLLLQNLAPFTNRQAQFRTVITLILAGKIHQFEGTVKGEILTKKRGSQGFGYDPVFQPEGFNKTFAEMTIAEKNPISHRGIAVQKLIAFLENF
jgi:XTP/dITP diphosphohydrolase